MKSVVISFHRIKNLVL